MLLMLTYTYFLYTDFVTDVEMRYIIGWITICGSGIIIFGNIMHISLAWYERFKVRLAQRRTQKAYEARMQKIRAEFLK
jgi:hypothetical protein